MSQSVADYMKNFASSTISNASNAVNTMSNNVVAAQVLEMVALASTVGKDSIKVMNDQTKQLEKQYVFDQELIKQIKDQKSIAKSLLKGKSIDYKQQEQLNTLMNKFYDSVQDYNINATKFNKNLQKFADSDVPLSVKNRLNNDIQNTNKNAKHISGSKVPYVQFDSKSLNSGPFKIIRDVKRILDKSYTETKQFRGWVTNTWSSAWFSISNGFSDLIDKLNDGSFWQDLLKTALILLGSGVLSNLFKGKIPDISGSVGKFLENLFRVSSGIGAIMGKLEKTYPTQAAKVFKKLDELYTEIGGKILYAIDDIMSNPLVRGAKAMFQPLIDGLLLIGRAIGRIRIPLLGELSNVFRAIGSVFKGAFDVIGGISKGAAKVLKVTEAIPILGVAINAIFSFFDFFYGFVKTSGTLWTKIRGGIANLLSGLTFGLVSFQTMAHLLGVEDNVDFGQNSGQDNRSWWDKLTGQGQDYSKGPQGSNPSTQGNNWVNNATTSVGNTAASIGNFFTDISGKNPIGSKILSAAKNIVGGNRKPTGHCARGVREALTAAGVNKESTLGNGYEVGSHLANNKNFKEVNMSPSRLPSLPAGSVVSWGKGTTPYGHVSIADGHGNEYSDFVGRQRTTTKRRDGLYYGNPRVFVPVSSERGGSDEYGNELTNNLWDIARMFMPSGLANTTSSISTSSSSEGIYKSLLNRFLTNEENLLNINSAFKSAISPSSFTNIETTSINDNMQRSLMQTMKQQAYEKSRATQKAYKTNTISMQPTNNKKTDIEDVTLQALQALIF